MVRVIIWSFAGMQEGVLRELDAVGGQVASLRDATAQGTGMRERLDAHGAQFEAAQAQVG